MDDNHEFAWQGRRVRAVHGFTLVEWTRLCKAANEVVHQARADGILLAGPNGESEPIVDDEMIAFNGVGEANVFESFVLRRQPIRPCTESDMALPPPLNIRDFEWCKTHGRPYGAAVALVLRCAKKIAPDAIALGSSELEHALVARMGIPEQRQARVRRQWRRLRRHVHYLGKATHALRMLLDKVRADAEPHTAAEAGSGATRPPVLMGL